MNVQRVRALLAQARRAMEPATGLVLDDFERDAGYVASGGSGGANQMIPPRLPSEALLYLALVAITDALERGCSNET